jgi:hypothetical protein
VTDADDVAAILNFKWSGSRGIVGKAEHIVLVLSSTHILLNGVLFSKVLQRHRCSVAAVHSVCIEPAGVYAIPRWQLMKPKNRNT